MHLFFQENNRFNFLENEEARHCTRVLRVSVEDTILVTDGKGSLREARLTRLQANKVEFSVVTEKAIARPAHRIHMAVCPTRKAERNEWMVEKMTELGVQKIQFVVSEHTHRETVRRVVNLERLNRIALSAMKQSQQFFLPEISIHSSFGEFLAQVSEAERYIAYVAEDPVPDHLFGKISGKAEIAILIGPEGDFSEDEIQKAFQSGFEAVSLGSTRLRTETAAVIACHSARLALDQKF